jgi:hypothetical protein
MSRPKKTARRKRPALATLPKPAKQKPVSEPNLHARRSILDNLHDTIGSCEDRFAAHGSVTSRTTATPLALRSGSAGGGAELWGEGDNPPRRVLSAG